jgi:hypothetical protein
MAHRGRSIVVLVMLGAPLVLLAESAELVCNIQGIDKPIWAALIGLVGSSLWLIAAALVATDVWHNVLKQGSE